MMILSKICGVAVLIWFYMAGKKLNENAVKWALIGLTGYWLAWWLSKEFFLIFISGLMTKETVMAFVMSQLPAAIGIAVAFFVKGKLTKDAENKE